MAGRNALLRKRLVGQRAKAVGGCRFHLLDDVEFYRRPKPGAVVSAKDDDGPLSSFTWNEVVFRSFQAGFLKKLDLDLYRRLKLATAKRMYRFLDKRFHFSNTLHFKLPVFACEHIGLSRRYDAAQLKRRLSPAVAELEQAGYLVPLPAKDRFHRLRRGLWEVVFVRTPKLQRQRRPVARLSDLENRLIERGVTPSSAAQLVREHAADLIEGKIAVFDALRQGRDRRVSWFSPSAMTTPRRPALSGKEIAPMLAGIPAWLKMLGWSCRPSPALGQRCATWKNRP